MAIQDYRELQFSPIPRGAWLRRTPFTCCRTLHVFSIWHILATYLKPIPFQPFICLGVFGQQHYKSALRAIQDQLQAILQHSEPPFHSHMKHHQSKPHCGPLGKGANHSPSWKGTWLLRFKSFFHPTITTEVIVAQLARTSVGGCKRIISASIAFQSWLVFPVSLACDLLGMLPLHLHPVAKYRVVGALH